MREQLVKSTEQIYDGTSKCTSITVHETANTSPGADAQAHADLQSGANVRQASWHISVDDTEAIRSYPDTAQCWHAGPASKDSIAVEICVNADGNYNQAFRRAAEVVRELRIKHNLGRSAVVQHHAWTGKDCPDKMRAASRWEEFLKLTDPIQKKEVKPVARMVSPFEGRLTQNHADSGGYAGHKGMDIAPPKPGQVGKPVYAAFDGEVKKVARGIKPGNRNSTWAPGRTGNGVLVANPDGEGNGYNHIRVADHWRVGDKVKRGDLLGHNDRSGNQTAPHLHFELWADWRNPDSDYDPQLAFKKFGIKPGSAPVLDVKPAGNITPANPKPKPVPVKPKPAPSAGVPAHVKSKLKAMGFTKQGIAEVKAYQEWHGLHPDGDWGARTEAKYQEVVHAQNATKKMKGVPDSWASDGYWGKTSKKWAAYTSGRNGWNNPGGLLTASYINNLKKAQAW